MGIDDGVEISVVSSEDRLESKKTLADRIKSREQLNTRNNFLGAMRVLSDYAINRQVGNEQNGIDRLSEKAARF